MNCYEKILILIRRQRGSYKKFKLLENAKIKRVILTYFTSNGAMFKFAFNFQYSYRYFVEFNEPWDYVVYPKVIVRVLWALN